MKGTAANVNSKRKFYSLKETAEILGLASITVFYHCKAKIFPSVLIGHRRLIPKAFIDSLEDKANQN